MRSAIILLIIFFQIRIASAQPYQSIFSSDTTRWNIFELAPDAGGTHSFYSYSDTIINQKLYHKLYHNLMGNPTDAYTDDAWLCGFIFEDTLTGEYWLRQPVDHEFREAKFMDLSLNKGDSIAIVHDYRDMDSEYVMVDSTYYEDGRKIIVIDQYNYNGFDSEKVKYVEGVGATNGFNILYMGMWPERFFLLCKLNNNIIEYSTDAEHFQDCFHEGGANIKENYLSKEVKIYPNPSKNKINIDLNNLDCNLMYKIINTSGLVVDNGFLVAKRTHIELNHKGVFLIIISDGEMQMTKKIINNGY